MSDLLVTTCTRVIGWAAKEIKWSRDVHLLLLLILLFIWSHVSLLNAKIPVVSILPDKFILDGLCWSILSKSVQLLRPSSNWLMILGFDSNVIRFVGFLLSSNHKTSGLWRHHVISPSRVVSKVGGHVISVSFDVLMLLRKILNLETLFFDLLM